MIIYKTVQKVISQDSQQKMQFLEYKTTLSLVVKLKPDFRPEPGIRTEPKLCVSHLSYL